MTEKYSCKFDRWADLLVSLKPKDNLSIHRLSRETDITYTHLHRMLTEFERLGWITTYIEGREKRIELTDTGKEMKNHALPIIIELKKKRGGKE
ncbi:unnamed protein product [marine sediment metagenome]|uniref:Uncharacterized protein n=1 Tax=marine sediment metagenome TaxID=412755 RepID=X0VS60_9ZZZZ